MNTDNSSKIAKRLAQITKLQKEVASLKKPRFKITKDTTLAEFANIFKQKYGNHNTNPIRLYDDFSGEILVRTEYFGGKDKVLPFNGLDGLTELLNS